MLVAQPHRSQHGLSLTELLISLATSLFLLSGVVGMFSATLSSQGDSLKATRLNQELRNVMDLMSRDIRRAGYWGLAYATGQPAGNLTLSATTGNITVTSSDTPFAAIGAGLVGRELISSYGAATITGYTDASTVSATVTQTFSATGINEGEWMLSNLFSETANDVAISGDQTCIQYAYDSNGDSTVDANERFAFRLSGTTVQMYPGSGVAPDCSNGNGNWVDLSSDTVSIDTLTFSDAGSQCINLSDASSDCYAVTPTSGNVLVYIRQIDITLTGSLAATPAVTRTLQESVRLRNDRMAVY